MLPVFSTVITSQVRNTASNNMAYPNTHAVVTNTTTILPLRTSNHRYPTGGNNESTLLFANSSTTSFLAFCKASSLTIL